MKEKKQSKLNKKRYTAKNFNFVSYMIHNSYDKKITRKELVEHYHMTDVAIRAKVSEMAMFFPIISLSQEKGYEVAKAPEELTEEQMLETIGRIDHQINEFQSRINALKRRMKPLIAQKKVYEKVIAERKEK